MKQTQIKTNGINLNVIEAGPEAGPLVVLLHGFPEFWYGWRKQIEFLASKGFRVLAPDQRGYNLSDKPAYLGAYTLDELAKDIVGLIESTGREKAIVVGHDWGGAVAWWIANKHADKVDKLCILNVPHHAVMNKTLQTNPRQLLRSWYIFFFQLPWLPERAIRAGRFKIATRALVQSSRRGTFSETELEKYREAWSQPAAMRSMINWYRAVVQKKPRPAKSPRIKPPTLLIWGKRDQFLGSSMAQPSVDLCENGRLEFIESATHWVQHEEPQRVNELMLGFFSQNA